MVDYKTNIRFDTLEGRVFNKERSFVFTWRSAMSIPTVDTAPTPPPVTATPPQGHVPRLHTPRRRLAIIGVGLAAVVSIIVIAFLWPTVTASVKSLPVAIVGPAAQASQVERALEKASPDTFDFVDASSRSAAIDLVNERKAYGAIVLGDQPEVLTASAASPIATQALTGVATALGAQFSAASVAAGGPAITVTTTELAPLVSADSRGTVIGAALFPLVLGGMLGGILITILVVGVWRRVSALMVYAVVAGLAIAAILEGWFAVLQGNYFVTAGAIGLGVLAIGGVIVGFAALVGPRGILIGPVLFLLIANPIASAAAPLEFLPQPWGLVGQWFPPGAAATLLRDLSYFPAANLAFPWLVLAGWAVLGLVFAIGGHFRERGAALRTTLQHAVIE
jgi:hypothetical protein